jgi:hypothetical protein
VSWPSFTPPLASERALIVAAIGPAPRAATAWEEWSSRIVLDDLEYDVARLLPQVFTNLLDQGEADRLPARVRGKYRWVWTTNKLRVKAVEPALDALADAGIAVMALKGAASLAAGLLAWGAREMGDIDVAVAPEHAGDAARVLEAGGWRAQHEVSADIVARRMRDRRHSWNFTRAGLDQVDLHWHVLASRPTPAVARDYWRHARDVTLGSVVVKVPDDVGIFLGIVEHATRNEPMNRLLWIVDASRVLARVDPDELVRRARRLGLVSIVAAACDTIADVVGPVGDVDPGAIAARLRSLRLPLVESVAAWTDDPRFRASTLPRVAAQVRSLTLHGVGGRGTLPALRAFARRRIEPSLWRHPVFGAAITVAGRPRRAQAMALRYLGPLSRPPEAGPLVLGEWLDLGRGESLDRVAGSGWCWPERGFVWAEGVEARLVIDAPVPAGQGLTLEFEPAGETLLSPTPNVTVFVNERPVADWDARHVVADGPISVDVPAWLVDWCRPLEVTFRTREVWPPGGWASLPVDLRPFLCLKALGVC